jgi:hypothetical protein
VNRLPGVDHAAAEPRACRLRQLRHPTKVGRVTVAGHPNDELAPGTLRSILRQANLEP